MDKQARRTPRAAGAASACASGLRMEVVANGEHKRSEVAIEAILSQLNTTIINTNGPWGCHLCRSIGVVFGGVFLGRQSYGSRRQVVSGFCSSSHANPLVPPRQELVETVLPPPGRPGRSSVRFPDFGFPEKPELDKGRAVVMDADFDYYHPLQKRAQVRTEGDEAKQEDCRVPCRVCSTLPVCPHFLHGWHPTRNC